MRQHYVGRPPCVAAASTGESLGMLALSIVYAGALVWISAIAQHLNNLTVHGARWVTSDRSQPIADDGFTGRSTRALRNNLESAAMYVPVALVVLFLHPASAIATWASHLYGRPCDLHTRLLAEDQPGPLPVLADRDDLHPRPLRQPPGFGTVICCLASSHDSPSC
jgi:uncharacterized MAPEG superfamily protein